MDKFKHGNIGKLIYDCNRHGISPADENKLPNRMRGGSVKQGRFAFHASRHDTGISVYAVIIHPETGETYEIINGTYWNSEGTYGFNEFTWNGGKWDEALDEAIIELQRLLAAREEYHNKQDADFVANKAKEEQAEKEKFEATFK